MRYVVPYGHNRPYELIAEFILDSRGKGRDTLRVYYEDISLPHKLRQNRDRLWDHLDLILEVNKQPSFHMRVGRKGRKMFMDFRPMVAILVEG
jgi:hypothetical protein